MPVERGGELAGFFSRISHEVVNCTGRDGEAREILRDDEVLELLLGGKPFRDRLIDGVGAVIGGSAFLAFTLDERVAADVPRSDRRIAEDDRVEPTGIIEFGIGV